MSPAKMPAFYALPAKVLGYAKRDAPRPEQRTCSSLFSATRLSRLLLAALNLFCLVVSAFAEAPREIQRSGWRCHRRARACSCMTFIEKVRIFRALSCRAADAPKVT